MQLRDANLARLPALISLVNQLRARTKPDTFTSSDIQFNIDGAYVNLDQFDLHGDSLSLKGQGWIAMNRQLKVAFYTLPGGEKSWLPFAKRLSQQAWQILVDGTLTICDGLVNHCLPSTNYSWSRLNSQRQGGVRHVELAPLLTQG